MKVFTIKTTYQRSISYTPYQERKMINCDVVRVKDMNGNHIQDLSVEDVVSEGQPRTVNGKTTYYKVYEF